MSTRASLLRATARAHGLDGFIGFRPEEVVMMAGYQPHWGLSFCWFPAEGEPVLYIPELEPPHIPPKSFRIETFPWGIMNAGDPWERLFAQLAAEVGPRKAGWRSFATQTVPSAAAAEAPPLPRDFRLPGADATPAIDSLFTQKTSEEIERIRRANAVARIGIEQFFATLEPGQTEAEVAARVEASIHSQTGKGGISQARAWAFVQSGPNTAFTGRFNRSSGRALCEGDLVTLELGTCVEGYWSDLTRTGTVGPLSAKHRSLLETVRAAQSAALRAVRPGVTAESVDAAARAVVNAAGLGPFFNHATGHPVGFRYHDLGPVLMPGSQTVLEPGMVLTIEPGIYAPELGGGCRIEENIVVTTNGFEPLSF